jgi:hypothetical protein
MRIPSLTLLCCLSTVASLVYAQAARPDFGPNVTIFDSSMPSSAIQSAFDAVQATQAPPVTGQPYTSGTGQFNNVRHAFLFKPGSYSGIQAFIGYYTSVAGLGISPDDVTVNGTINSIGVGPTNNPKDQADGLNNFWRSIENMRMVWQGFPFEEWTTSQACPMRRMHISDNLFFLSPYLTNGFTSGGFIADSVFDPQVISGSQQQWITRNSVLNNGWSNGVWNQVFSGVVNAPAQNFPATAANGNPYTTLATSPVTSEKPFLYVDSAGNFNVFVPALEKNSSGVTWANGPAPGSSIPISDFFIAQPTDSAARINFALALGKHLILAPGIYSLDEPIVVLWPNTVVLGLGFPTLVPAHGNVAMAVANVPGVKLSGMIFDAGPVNSPVLLKIGLLPSLPILRGAGTDPNNPTLIQDVFFRIGGATPGQATTSLQVNPNNVILDDIWAWRADHGAGVGWTSNTADTGLIVNGDNVTAYGLFVEHYQKYEVIWNGNGGTEIFFQNEMPYDPPSQAAWMEAPGVDGWAAFKVANTVTSFRGYGMGSYSFFNQGVNIYAANAFEVPFTLAPSSLNDLLTIFLSTAGSGGILNVVNGTGGSSTIANPDVPVTVVSYP